MSVNKVTLIGNVGKEPEIKQLDNGTKIANFPLATSETWKDKNGEKVEQVEWHNISIFGKLAEIVEMFVNKGTLLYCEGKIKTRSWDDKDGNKRYTTDIIVSELRMLGGKQKENEASKNEPNDDLPY